MHFSSPAAGNKAEQPLIYCVDDTPANLSLLHGYLSGSYKVKLINSGEKALALLDKEHPDLVLLDVMMPGLDGFEVCRRIRNNPETRHIPILFITAKNTADDEQEALQAGGNDFISKPINPKVLSARVKTHLELKNYQDLLRQENRNLEVELQQRLSDIFKLQDATLAVMISMAEFRDEDTGNHIKRTQLYIAELAKEFADCHPDVGLDARQIELIVKAAPLHDIGKIGIPDHILLKPGKLTPEEFEVMKTHAQKGYDMLQTAAKGMGYYGEFLNKAQEVAISHHEKWNGSGYPHGLAGDAIPLAGRMMAVVDVYDALTSHRPYKKAWSHADAIAFIQDQAGQHFDPNLTAAFLRIEARIARIQDVLADPQV